MKESFKGNKILTVYGLFSRNIFIFIICIDELIFNNLFNFQDIALQENREIRKLEWEKFVNDMSEKCEKVNQTFDEKENEIKEFYIDLERKLHITS